jgi:hypothetical protein
MEREFFYKASSPEIDRIVKFLKDGLVFKPMVKIFVRAQCSLP